MNADETARLRDVTAESRDDAAAARDTSARHTERTAGPTSADLLVAIERLRAEAMADRVSAATDRERAHTDRMQAAEDRRQAQADIRHAQLDGLTGVFMRNLGWVSLEREIDRSRRSDQPFALAFVDVDGLKALNDSEGHAAGDALLQGVAIALRSQLRPYDPIVRIGGDEFVCGLTNTKAIAARRRGHDLETAVERTTTGSISVGVAALEAGDTVEELVARADADLYARRQLTGVARDARLA